MMTKIELLCVSIHSKSKNSQIEFAPKSQNSLAFQSTFYMSTQYFQSEQLKHPSSSRENQKTELLSLHYRLAGNLRKEHTTQELLN